MPRLNIYVPDRLHEEIERAGNSINLSRVCSEAIRDVLSARSEIREVDYLQAVLFQGHTELEARLATRYGLRTVVARAARDRTSGQGEAVAHWSAMMIDRLIGSDMQLAIGGGTQMWDAVRRLKPRPVQLTVSALGFGHVDARVPHAHPNMLASLLSLVYAPRARAMLVGAPDFTQAWSIDSRAQESPWREPLRRVIIGSCAPFRETSPYADLLGKETTDFLQEEIVAGDYLGVFCRVDGGVVEPYTASMVKSHLTAGDLQAHAKRGDTIVALAAAGDEKLEIIRRVLRLGLCNTLITDEPTARALR